MPECGARLEPEHWMARAEEYSRRVETFLSRHRSRGGNPVGDFLFTYYSLRPRQLRCWHPGFGVLLAGDDAVRHYRSRRGYTVRRDGVTVSETTCAAGWTLFDSWRGCCGRPRGAQPGSTVSVCTNGRWSIAARPCATAISRCGCRGRPLTRWWSQCPCGAAISTLFVFHRPGRCTQ